MGALDRILVPALALSHCVLCDPELSHCSLQASPTGQCSGWVEWTRLSTCPSSLNIQACALLRGPKGRKVRTLIPWRGNSRESLVGSIVLQLKREEQP